VPLVNIGDFGSLSLEASQRFSLMSEEDFAFVHIHYVNAARDGLSRLPRHPEIEPVAVAASVGVRAQVHIEIAVGGLNDLFQVA